MKKRFIISTLMVLFLGTIALSQSNIPDFPSNWNFTKQFWPTGAIISVHGVGVTPDGCVWINVYGANAAVARNTSIAVMNPDGTEKSMILSLTFDDGVEYDLFNDGGNNSRGMSVGPDGNVYFSAFKNLYVVDYQTMEGILRLPLGELSITTACADEFNNIVVSNVACSQNGVKIYSGEDGEFMSMAIPVGDPNLAGTSRDLALTTDGLYLAIGCTGTSTDGVGVSLWYSEDGTFGPYTFVQEIGDYGATGEEVHFDQYGRLWVGQNSNAPGNEQKGRYDCWDIKANPPQIVDYIIAAISAPDPCSAEEFAQGAIAKPRGFWLSNDGSKAYVTTFERGVQEWAYTGYIDAKEPQAVPEGFALSQNYPNPFNPSTNFSYSLPKTSDVRIAIYDLFGREINTLVNESKEAGTYTISWNGRDNQNRQVSTGVYFYKMQATGFEKTMKMMLVK